jgi:hypothetical protein
LRQCLVTRKNRKIRTLRALHPEIHIEVLYRRDYEAILAGGEIAAVEAFLVERTIRTA